MPGENETFEGGLDAVAESLMVGGDDTPAPKTPITPNRVAEGADQVSEDDVDNSVDPADLDLLEDGDNEETPDEDEDYDPRDYQDDVDPDEVEHDVVVDGAPTKAKLKDLKAA